MAATVAGFVAPGSGLFHETGASSEDAASRDRAATLTGMVPSSQAARPTSGSFVGTRDLTAVTIGAVVVAIVVGLALLRAFVAPGSPSIADGDALAIAEGSRGFVGPLGMLVEIVVQLVALTALARLADRRGWRPVRFVIFASVLGMGIATGHAVVIKLAMHAESPLSRALIAGPVGGMQVFALWLLAYRYPKLTSDARVRELEAERLRLEADRLRQAAELSRLREHLQPHFLRNALNAIAAHVSADPAAACDLLAALGDLLTESIENDRAVQSLDDELTWLKRYAEILEARYRSDLRFVWQLDPRASTAVLPRLLLQPLVENAVEHGALARRGDGQVVVRTVQTDRGVCIVVEDNGPGFDPTRPDGLGLRLVRQRLALECVGSALYLETSPAGTRAIVELP
jgi:signal transduction histidine kinase